MLIESSIARALALPPTQISYEVDRTLAAMQPARAVLQVADWSFNLRGYAAAGLCALGPKAGVHHEFVTYFNAPDAPLGRGPMRAWYEVEWQGHKLEVLYLDWLYDQRHWVLGADDATARAFVHAVCAWAEKLDDAILVYEDGYAYKSEELYEAIRGATFDNLILPAPLARALREEFTQFFAARAHYERYGIPWKRGALFVGPPGNGKTHALKALINHLEKPCLYVRSMRSGWAVSGAFALARRRAPCMVVFEDLDGMLNEHNRTAFLNELDGFAANTGLVTLATTNHPERLDPAIIERPSRFDRKYPFTLPASEERERYLARWNEQVEPELRLTAPGLADIVVLTDAFSFAYLKELTVSSMMRWIGDPQPGAMDVVMREQALLLREQMGATG